MALPTKLEIHLGVTHCVFALGSHPNLLEVTAMSSAKRDPEVGISNETQSPDPTRTEDQNPLPAATQEDENAPSTDAVAGANADTGDDAGVMSDAGIDFQHVFVTQIQTGIDRHFVYGLCLFCHFFIMLPEATSPNSATATADKEGGNQGQEQAKEQQEDDDTDTDDDDDDDDEAAVKGGGVNPSHVNPFKLTLSLRTRVLSVLN